MKIKAGEIITLENNEEYIVMEEVTLEEVVYFVLMTAKKPTGIKIALKEAEDEITIVEDDDLKKKILGQMI